MSHKKWIPSKWQIRQFQKGKRITVKMPRDLPKNLMASFIGKAMFTILEACDLLGKIKLAQKERPIEMIIGREILKMRLITPVK